MESNLNSLKILKEFELLNDEYYEKFGATTDFVLNIDSKDNYFNYFVEK